MDFMEALRARWSEANSLVCVGLDPEPARFSSKFADDGDAVLGFCRDIVDATAGFACCFKPQIAHFAALGAEDALERLVAHVHDAHPGIPVILDAKRGDIGSTARHYAVRALPEAIVLRRRVEAGAESLMALPAEAFLRQG